MQTVIQCPHCSHQLSQTARFCAYCGKIVNEAPSNSTANVGQTMLLPTSSHSDIKVISKEERDWAMYCHISAMLVFVIPYAHIVAPLILWMMKRETSDFINDQGKEALNYNLSIMIYMTLAAISSCFLIGFPVLIGLALFDLVIMVVAAMRAANGEYYRYPITIRFIK